MKTLIAKELRENFKTGAIGFVMCTLLVLGAGLAYSRFIDAIALGNRTNVIQFNNLHPLTSETFPMAVGWLCGVFGALLGWLQIHNEKHRDLWAFLLHRPIPRTHIFWAKVFAGLSLYTLGAGLPLSCFLLWIRTPGHVAAPFEWAMAWPIAALFLLGIVWYLAGMLTRLREARWYASRALGLGAAVLATGAALTSWQWWEVSLVLAGCSALLALAVWGGFHSHGHYEPQPALGKIALTTSITFGTSVLVAFAAMLIVYLFPGMLFHEPWSQYVMAKDGIVYKLIHRWGGVLQMVDFQGNLLKDVHTWQDSQGRLAPTFPMPADFNARKPADRYMPPFTYWNVTPDTIWFHWTRYGRLVGFNLATRRLIGNLGPAGFSLGRSQPGDRFDIPAQYLPNVSRRTLHTTTHLYEVDIDKRTVRSLFATTHDDPIGAASNIIIGREQNTAVLTRRWLQLIGSDDQTIWRIPFEQPRPDYTDVRISIIDPAQGRFAVWIGPSPEADTKSPGKLPIHVTWIRAPQDVLSKKELPPLSSPNLGNALQEKFIGIVMPPALIVALFLLTDETMPWKIPIISLAITALIYVPSVLWLCRRYRFSIAAQIGWAFFHLLFGLPALLAFLSVHEWPARERCPNCNKLRAVNRQQCEHCGAEFSPPARDSTEIFEPLGSAPSLRS